MHATAEIQVWSADRTAELHLKLRSSTLPPRWEVYVEDALLDLHRLSWELPLTGLEVYGDLRYAESIRG